MGVKHLTSEGMYEEILPGVDVHYTLQSQRLKENIRLKTAQAAEQELIFHLRYTDMEILLGCLQDNACWSGWSAV